MRSARIAVAGVGLIGRRHAEIVAREAVLAGIADPSPAAVEVAEALGAPLCPDIETLLAETTPDALVVATPNQCHEADGLASIRAGVPVLIEKPLADDVGAAARLVEAADDSGVPLLVGHHRRYNPIIEAAKSAIDTGRLGRIVTAQATCWLMKPDPYFNVDWRRQPGAGPVLINLIHDVDLMLHLCGDVTSVQAVEAAAIRGFAVEDTAAAILQFANGAVGTMTVSDTVVAPWSWELTAAENPAYPETDASAYQIGGTEGALSIPDLTLWHNPGARGWHEPIGSERLEAGHHDPLIAQIHHLADVALSGTKPMVDGEAGLRALSVLMAIKQAAKTGTTIRL